MMQEPSSKRPWQLSVRALLMLTAAAAVATAVAVAKGLSALPMPIGMVLAFLNVRGCLKPFQTSQARGKLFPAAWVLFGASLLLPAAKGCGNANIYGWRAAIACATVEVEAAGQTISALGGRDHSDVLNAPAHVYLLLLNIANLLLLLSPFFLWRLHRGKGQIFLTVFPVAAASVWFPPFEDDKLLVGYYVWCASTAVLVAACRIRWPSFAAMVLLSAYFLSQQ